MTPEQKIRLVNVLTHFVTASNRAYPSGMLASKKGDAETYEEYADSTLRLFGIPANEVRFVLTPEERAERAAQRKEEQKQYRREEAARRRKRAQSIAANKDLRKSEATKAKKGAK